MLLWKCLFSFVSRSSEGNKTINQKSGKITYAGWGVVDTVWDSCRVRTVKLVKPISSDEEKAKCPQAWEGGIRGTSGRMQTLVGSGAAHHSGPAGTPCPPPHLAHSEGPGVPQPRCPACLPMSGRNLGLSAGEGCGVCDGGGSGLWRTAGSRAWLFLTMPANILTLALTVCVGFGGLSGCLRLSKFFRSSDL